MGMRLARVAGLLAFLAALAGCTRERERGPVKITYWEKWTKFEGQACADMVAAFNRKFKGRIEGGKIHDEEVSYPWPHQTAFVIFLKNNPVYRIWLAAQRK